MQWVLLSSFVCLEHWLKDLINCWNVEQAPLNLLFLFFSSHSMAHIKKSHDKGLIKWKEKSYDVCTQDLCYFFPESTDCLWKCMTKGSWKWHTSKS